MLFSLPRDPCRNNPSRGRRNLVNSEYRARNLERMSRKRGRNRGKKELPKCKTAFRMLDHFFLLSLSNARTLSTHDNAGTMLCLTHLEHPPSLQNRKQKGGEVFLLLASKKKKEDKGV